MEVTGPEDYDYDYGKGEGSHFDPDGNLRGTARPSTTQPEKAFSGANNATPKASSAVGHDTRARTPQ